MLQDGRQAFIVTHWICFLLHIQSFSAHFSSLDWLADWDMVVVMVLI
jgi:hypothetical protein